MKKVLLTTALVLGMAASASAMTYVDNKYGTFNDGVFINIGGTNEPTSVTLDFDILLKGYNPTAEQIVAASLSFDFWSEDPQDETMTIKAGIYDGNKLIKEQSYDLGGWEKWYGSGNKVATTTLDIDLKKFLDFTQDGLFTTIVLALPEEWFDWDNDFRLEGATFTAITEQNPGSEVPEPGTMLLMGAGLAGVAGFSRRRKK